MTLGVGVDHVIDAACSSQAVSSLNDETGEVLLTADAVVWMKIDDWGEMRATHEGSPARRKTQNWKRAAN